MKSSPSFEMGETATAPSAGESPYFEIADIPVGDIRVIEPNGGLERAEQLRVDRLVALGNNVKLGRPVIVTRNGKRYRFVAGGLQLSAATALGFKTVNCAAFSAEVPESLALLVEKSNLKNFNPVEEGELLADLIERCRFKQSDLSKILNSSQANISESYSLNRLPCEVRNDRRGDETVCKGKLIRIARLPSGKQAAAYWAAKAEAAKTNQGTEEEIRRDVRKVTGQMLRLSRAVEHLKRKVSEIDIDLGEVEALEVVGALRMVKGSMSYIEKFYAPNFFHRSPKLFRRFISAVRGRKQP